MLDRLEEERSVRHERVLRMLETDDSEGLKRALDEMPPAEIALFIADLGESDQKVRILGLLSEEAASDVLAEMADTSRGELLRKISTHYLSRLVDRLDSDDAADLIADLPKERAQEILESIDREEAGEVRQLLRYPEDTAGGIMQLEVAWIPVEAAIGQAIEKVRSLSQEIGDIHNLFVVDRAHKLVGTMPLRKLLLYDLETPIESVMEKQVVTASENLDQEEVARRFRHYDLVSLPVVSVNGVLLGRITVDDVVDVIEEEATEDILRMAGTDREDLDSRSTFRVVRVRLPWLLTCLFGGLGAGAIIHWFKVALVDVISLAVFIPVIMATGGNSGIQSSTIVVRSLATGSLDLHRVGRMLAREAKVAGLTGIICGLIVGVIAHLWVARAQLGLVIGGSMFFSILFATTFGASIPVVFRRVGIDPAVASGPLITTMNDIIGLSIYFGIAMLMMRTFGL